MLGPTLKMQFGANAKNTRHRQGWGENSENGGEDFSRLSLPSISLFGVARVSILGARLAFSLWPSLSFLAASSFCQPVADLECRLSFNYFQEFLSSV